ncbi:MAG TPA: hypothetical protein VMH50_16360 [Thermoleophilia bacterium]|nr:hypothetical protein [Thermoleophilia bacterium]
MLARRKTPAPWLGHPAAALVSAAAVCLCVAVLAACGGSSGDASPSATAGSPGDGSPPAASASPTPVPSPQITSGPPPAGAVAVAARYWRLQSQNRFAAARELLSPTSPMQAGWPGTDAIVKAHLVRAQGPVLVRSLKPSETVEFPVRVYVVPKYAVGNWNGPGTYVQYMGFVRMSDGSWRLMETGTGE